MAKLKLDEVDWEKVFDVKGVKVEELDRRGVGTAFEPRLEIDYKVTKLDGEIFYNRRLVVCKRDWSVVGDYYQHKKSKKPFPETGELKQ